MVRIRFFLSGALCFLLGSVALQAQQFTITNQQLVSSVRASLYQYDYTYSIAVTNNGPDALNVSATVTSSVAQTIVRSGNLSFGAVSQGQTVTSTSTLVIRQDRRYAFSWSNLQWHWSSTATAGWAPTTLATTLFPGTMQLVSLALTSQVNLTNVSLLVSGSGASFASIGPPTVALQANQPANVSVMLEIPSGTLPTTVQLTVSAFSGLQKIAADATVVLTVVNPSGIPGSPARPSDDRIVQAPSGLWVVEDQLMVMLSSDTADPAATITAIASQTGGVIVGSIPGLHAYQLQYPGMAGQLQSIAAQIKSLPNVRGAIQEYMVGPAQTPPPTITYQGQPLSPLQAEDEYFNQLWGLQAIKAPTAWAVLQAPGFADSPFGEGLPLSPGFAKVPIAIVDADLDPSHPDLLPNLNASQPIFKNQGWLRNQTLAGGHGTAVAGIACARGNNGIGVTGATWDCDLRLSQVLLDNQGHFDVFELVCAAYKAVEDGARILNISSGYGDPSCASSDPAAAQQCSEDTLPYTVVADQVKEEGRDVLVVIAGNEGKVGTDENGIPDNLTLLYPHSTITVAAVDPSGNLANFSNYGTDVTVAAPGVGIFSTLPVNEMPAGQPPYGLMGGAGDGTSFAAPFVSGVAALVWSMHPDYTAHQVHDCIVASSKDKDNVPGTSFGIIDAAKATVCGSLAIAPPPNDTAYIVNSASGTVQVPMPLALTVVDLWGKSVQVNLPASAVTWESSDPTIATVALLPQCAPYPQASYFGVCFALIPLKPGIVTITAQSDVTFNNIPPGTFPALPFAPNSLTVQVSLMCGPPPAWSGAGSNGIYPGTYLTATYKHVSGGGSNFHSDWAGWFDALLVVPTGGIPWGTPFDMSVGVTATGSGSYGSWDAYIGLGPYLSDTTYAFAFYYPRPPGDQGFMSFFLPCVGYGCGYTYNSTFFPMDPFINRVFLGVPFQVSGSIDASADGWVYPPGCSSSIPCPGSVSVNTTWNGITNVVNLNTGQPISYQVYSCSGTQY